MGEETMSQSRKRKTNARDETQSKRARNSGSSSDEETAEMINELVPGKIARIFLKNFMCHDALEMKFNSRINFLVGVNGSGKSAILTALTVGFGAKARDTDRGASLKGFVKQGKSSAAVEITITNRGDKSYEWETYGDTITIVRHIGATSYYRIKSHYGEVISTKREELDRIVKALNIQVDNPISILNQDAARSFLASKKPEDLYKLYMRATRLDVVGENYRQAQAASDLAKSELAESRKYLKENDRILKVLRQKLKALESLDLYREECQELEQAVLWAEVKEEEKKLLHLDKKIDHHTKEIEKLEDLECNKAAKDKEINSQIEEHKARIASLEAQAAATQEKTEAMRKKAVEAKKLYEEKKEKAAKLHNLIKNKQKDLEDLTNEIEKMESAESQADEKRQNARLKLENAEQQLDEVNATLKTKQTELLHLEENKNRISHEETSIKMAIERTKMEINGKRRDLQTFEKQPNNALNVYGSNYPRLVRRIEEEYKKGRFQKKPVGPVGSFISVKDQNWIPAIESHLGAKLLTSFCVDNNQDGIHLNKIMKEVFHDSPPGILNSKFFDQVHDVSRKCTRSSRYPNIYDMLDVTDVTITNTLIDQRDIERVVLIPTSEEACKVMENVNNVPQNCKLAYTKRCDLFYPDPNYKTYGGKGGRPKFLQVSTGDHIQTLQEELNEKQGQLQTQQEEYAAIVQRKNQTQQEHNQVTRQVRSLLGKRSEYKDAINQSREVLDSYNNNIINEHKNEIEHIKKWIDDKQEEQAPIMEELRRVRKESEAAGADYKECRNLTTNVDATLNPIKEKIRELKDEQKRLDANSKGANKRLQEAKQVLQKLNGEHQQLQRAVDTKTATANAVCPRIETTKSVNEINNRMRELKKFIEDVENEHGDKDSLKQELDEQEGKYAEVRANAETLEIFNERHSKRSKVRRRFFQEMKQDVADKVQQSFSNILSLRNYEGTVKVDYHNCVLDLEMIPINDAKRLTKDAKSLSGGERSYSTIGFILALWNCTGLPFYFLDEFDVFMDKINRRMIMDILIHHAKANAQSQFTFLTPLDASHVKADDMISIHRMAPPERE